MNIQTLVLSLTLFSSISFSSTLIDVVKIAGKNQVQVAEILGKATSCFKSKYGQKCYYTVAEIEIFLLTVKQIE